MAGAEGAARGDEVVVKFTEAGRLGITFWTESTSDPPALSWRPVIEALLPSGLAAALPDPEDDRQRLRPGLALVAVQGVSVADLDGEASVAKVAAASRPLELAFRPLPPQLATAWRAEMLRRAASDGDLPKAKECLVLSASLPLCLSLPPSLSALLSLCLSH